MLKMKLSKGHDFTIVNGISRIGYMSGGKKARWVDEDMADTIAGKAAQFIEKHQDEPFFLYFATHDVHVPRVPHPRFKGTSQCGVRGDVIQELDWHVGHVLETLDRLKLADDTIVIFTSDNGPVIDDGYDDGAVENLNGHAPAGPLNGKKYSLFEGGTRVPFIVRWPNRVKPGESAALVDQIDLLASLAALNHVDLPTNAAPDSLNMLSALLGESDQGRDYIVEHANGLAIREGKWKLIPARQLVGRQAQNQAKKQAAKNQKGKKQGGKGAGPKAQLYDRSKDLGETTNVAADHPEVVAKLTADLEKIHAEPRSRP
jgi:arylsulfatase A-like enzyme